MSIKHMVIGSMVFVFVVLMLLFYGWFMSRQKKVALGLADSVFPYADYSLSEIDTKFPQTANEGVVTTQTAEQTYNKLRRALLAENVSEASSLFYSRYKSKYEKIFTKAKKENKLADLAAALENTIERSSANCNESRCSYLMPKSGGEIVFIKNTRGVWLIESM